MSDGARHYELWRRGWRYALPLSVLVYVVSENVFCFLGTLAGYWLGRYLDPDLDQVGTTASEGRMINELPILGHILYGYWSIYGAVFRKHHRSFWTHAPVVSTFFRFIYQFWGLFLIMYLKGGNFTLIYKLLWGAFFGLCYADFLHWREDKQSLRKR